jgi:hypothetical protein
MWLYNLLIFCLTVPRNNIWVKVIKPSTCPSKVNYYELDPDARFGQWLETNRTCIEKDLDLNNSY